MLKSNVNNAVNNTAIGFAALYTYVDNNLRKKTRKNEYKWLNGGNGAHASNIGVCSVNVKINRDRLFG